MTETLIWITGASSGIGAALVATVPYDDAHVVDISRSGGTPRTEHVPADLSDPSSWAAVEAHLHTRMAAFAGRRAVFVHNAATIQPIGFTGEVASDAYRRNVLLNSAAGQALGHGFIAAVRSSGFGGEAHLVMISSGAATTVVPGWASYGAGKAALDHWVRSVGAEQEQRTPAVRVVAVAPGVVATAMQEQIRTADPGDFPDVERFEELHRTGALRAPEDAASAIWALLERDLDNGTVTDLRDTA